jgi:DNA uptake protein ComE-like DNA-binding protein
LTEKRHGDRIPSFKGSAFFPQVHWEVLDTLKKLAIILSFLILSCLFTNAALAESKKNTKKVKPAVSEEVADEVTEATSEEGATAEAPVTEPASKKAVAEVPAEGFLDVNSASFADLMTLPKMTRDIAEQIVLYRNTWGPFKHNQDLLRVQGLNRSILAAIRSDIAFGKGTEVPRPEMEVTTVPERNLTTDSKVWEKYRRGEPSKPVYEEPAKDVEVTTVPEHNLTTDSKVWEKYRQAQSSQPVSEAPVKKPAPKKTTKTKTKPAPVEKEPVQVSPIESEVIE